MYWCAHTLRLAPGVFFYHYASCVDMESLTEAGHQSSWPDLMPLPVLRLQVCAVTRLKSKHSNDRAIILAPCVIVQLGSF